MPFTILLELSLLTLLIILIKSNWLLFPIFRNCKDSELNLILDDDKFLYISKSDWDSKFAEWIGLK